MVLALRAGGLDAADGLGGGPPDRARAVAAQVDGHGKVDGDDLPGVDRPQALFCPTIMITPVLLAALDGDWLR